jgi:hypothetical protein
MFSYFTRTATIATIIAVSAMVTPSAQAVPVHEAWAVPGESGSTDAPPYAEPNPAIGGRTMAQYVADHVEHRIDVH